MSMHAIKEAFALAATPNDPAHKAIRCVAARMSYCDQSGNIGSGKRDHQLLEFDIVVPPDIKATIMTDPIPPGASLVAAAAAAAAAAVKAHSQ